MGLFSNLIGRFFGNIKSIRCKSCKKEGNLFKKGAAISSGQFEVIGKNSDAKLIIVCESCKTMFFYDTLWGGLEELSSNQANEVYSNLLK